MYGNLTTPEERQEQVKEIQKIIVWLFVQNAMK